MKIYDIEKIYNIDGDEFIEFMLQNELPYSANLVGTVTVDDEKIDEYVRAFEKQVEGVERQQRILAEEQLEKERELAQMLITSGFNFDGYTIKKYSGYISGDDAISISRGSGGIFSNSNVTDVGDSLMKVLSKIRRNALRELKEAAYDLGCNAVIGVDFDYITMEPETASGTGGTLYLPYVIGVTANGNAVIIEKDDD